MLPEEKPDAVSGKRLSFEQCLAHVGGEFVTDTGMALVRGAAHDYIWRYAADKAAWCTACGKNVGNMKAKHGARVRCPACGKTVEFRHAGRGHSSEFDRFYLYEWRKSAIDPETIVLTASYAWRDSRNDHPERAPIKVDYERLYIFRPGKAASVYSAGWDNNNRLNAKYWYGKDNISPAHTGGFGGVNIKFIMDWGEFRLALEGTRIGRTFELLDAASNRHDELELLAVANVARRPWLEYLAKSGQAALAAELMRAPRVPKDVAPRLQAKTPRELLGLTEGEWYEIRRDGVRLTTALLKTLRKLKRIGLNDVKIAEADRLSRDVMTLWRLEQIEPHRVLGRFDTPSVCDLLDAARVPEKLRRKACRRIVSDLPSVTEWRDYFSAVVRNGENLADPRFLLPKDMPAMHDRMTRRERLIREEQQAIRDAANAAKLDARYADFKKRLEKLRRQYCFSACGLVLRPYESAGEVIAEGHALDICIGTYAEGYLAGRNIICCLRRAEEPDEPWRAVEFSTRDGAVVQDRGYKNDWTYTARDGKRIEPGTRAQLRNFWTAWKQHNESERRKTA